ncbi:hypothetical protein IAQ61_009002 [Plenodomus lingam]|uniref:Uncharacterized protein n=1 Tax=Leptosphaeria maculans (strain JN3 / isolate v23.1.3 / race Av1-4-5-6-7-8) TaxID=985895 RepID=E4ZNS0_LEPMJ|nr:hypothetical protein LEMA_P041900.1 [Plenodomus lingam JN3]KAH9865056.1 hypothetical protein IAQ61_009002 [Plenodomus lingam]CBX93289.1 hypothetical protein LEMA_P041900.1 [Plenodomus lingam JN3]
MSKSPYRIINRYNPTTFKINYTPEYKTFTQHHIATDRSHPLYIAQKRRQAERSKEGLWWHVTTGVDLSKSSCVRTWARRRLRNAVREELQQRGYNHAGTLVDTAALKDRPELINVLRQGRSLDLKGSLRLHVLAPLIPAKYTVLCAETGEMIEKMLQVLTAESYQQPSLRNTGARPRKQQFLIKS